VFAKYIIKPKQTFNKKKEEEEAWQTKLGLKPLTQF
jgi:hypothetical protein